MNVYLHLVLGFLSLSFVKEQQALLSSYLSDIVVHVGLMIGNSTALHWQACHRVTIDELL